MLPVEQPFKTYTGLDGKPLNNGSVYFGLPGQDPITHPITVYWDAAGTLPAEQPLRTVNGYVVNDSGSAANVFYDSAYSQTVLDSKGRQVFYAPTSDDFSIATVVLNFLASLAASAGSFLIGFIQSGYGAIARTVQDVLRERIPSIENYGAADGQDSTTAVQHALDAHPVVWVPPGKTYLIDSVTIASSKRIKLDGTLKRIANAASDSYMIVNASGAAGDANIIIEGDGELDGNASAQTGDRQGLVKFQKPTDCTVRIRKAGNNRYDNTNPTTSGQGCIVFTDATRSHIDVRFLNLWQREGLFIDGASTGCSIRNVTALGDGSNSWSAVSISGAGATNNLIANIDAKNCGASSVGCDSTYSIVDQIRSTNNQFQNGLNLGHTGKPATGTRASNIEITNAGQGASSGTHCGVQVGGGSTDVDLTNITVTGAYSHCIQVSDGASDVQIIGARLSGALHGSGVNVFAADRTHLTGIVAKSNSDYGVNFNASNDCSIGRYDLRGNGINPFSSTGSRVAGYSGSASGTDALTGTVNLGGISAGGSIVVNNANVFGFNTRIKGPAPRNATAAAAQAFIATQATGSFTITSTNAVTAVSGPHNVQWDIL